jgi:hypothetical protein
MPADGRWDLARRLKFKTVKLCVREEFSLLKNVTREFSRNTNKMQLCNRIYYSKVYWRLNIFRAAHRSSSGALNCVCSLWFIYTCGDRPLPRLGGKWIHSPLSRSKHVEPSINFGIINSITKLHIVGFSTESSTMHGSMNIKFATRVV